MIFYRNTAGKEVVFSEPPFLLDITELAGFELEYETNRYTARNGGRVNGFSAGVITKDMSMGILESPDGIQAALDEVLAVTQYDVQKNLPGRLYVGDSYLLCNLYGSSVDTLFDPEIEYLEKTYKLVLSYPFWCREKKLEYLPGDREVLESDFLDYDYDYDYEYLFDDFALGVLENDHYADSDFEMVVYGPAVNPRITIGGHPYQVTVTLRDGEYMVIDSRTGRVVRITNAGTEINLFNARDKAYSVFQKIPPGNSTVAFDYTFGFAITLFQERSELRWNLS